MKWEFIMFYGVLAMLTNASDFSDSSAISEINYCDITDSRLIDLIKMEKLSPDTLYMNLEGNDLTSIPADMSSYVPQLERIILTGNERLSFPANGDPFLRSASLIELLCERCVIQEIFDRSLRWLPELEYLRLSDNHIKQIAAHAFHRNVKLQHVDLSSNKISRVPAQMLKGLFDIRVLDLSNNVDLGVASDAPFLVSDTLKELKCNNCGFIRYSKDTFSELTNLEKLSLDGNQILEIQYLPNLIAQREFQQQSGKNKQTKRNITTVH